MKKFTFPLARVLDWRRTQVRIEETKLERLHAGLRAVESKLEAVRNAREESGRSLLASGPVTGMELEALEHYRAASDAECARLQQASAQTRQRIVEQIQALLGKRRDVTLLEHLHGTRFAAWTKELQREIDREASELHLFKSHTR